jgi:ribonuclease BN (tRNA processing enzyme)
MMRTHQATALLDVGTGAFANLQEHIEYTDVDAIVISHMHADHFIDLIPYRYGLKYGPLLRDERLPLFLPPGGEAMLRKLCSAFAKEDRADFLDEVFEVSEYDASGVLEVGDMRMTFQPTVHYVDAYAIRVARGDASVVYSADTAPSEEVADFAAGCNLFLCEATLGLGAEIGERGHLSAWEAGELARRAGARRLLLTHYGADYAPQELVDAADDAFTGTTAIADDGMELAV